MYPDLVGTIAAASTYPLFDVRNSTVVGSPRFSDSPQVRNVLELGSVRFVES